jgi:uncharacterized protein with HEPN domain
MKHDDSAYLQHMLDAMDSVGTYLKGLDEAKFRGNALVQDAVIRRIGIIGEAAKRVSPTIRNRHDDIPWQDIAGMRDKLVHDYFGVDIGTVWLTATRDIPALRSRIVVILEEI